MRLSFVIVMYKHVVVIIVFQPLGIVKLDTTIAGFHNEYKNFHIPKAEMAFFMQDKLNNKNPPTIYS